MCDPVAGQGRIEGTMPWCFTSQHRFCVIPSLCIVSMKVIRHAGVDSRMIIFGRSSTPKNDSSLLIVTSMQRFTHHGLRQACVQNNHPTMYCELFIEMALMSKTATWSTYKHYNTVKYYPAGNHEHYIQRIR